MPDERFVQTPVGRLAVRVVDTGPGMPTAVLWQSLFVDGRSWSRIEEELEGDRRLVLITGPGHGRSGDPGRRYTNEECAEAAAHVVDALGIREPVDWVGNAWGGHVGILFAARWPERCRTLVTVGTPVHAYSPGSRAKVGALLLAYRLLGPAPFLRDGVVDALLSARTRAEDHEAVELVRDCFTNTDRALLGNAVVSISLRRRDLTPVLSQVQAPTLFITGAEHPDWTADQARRASELLPHGKTAILEDSAYLGPLEAPEECARLVREFWAAHGARSVTS